VQFLFFIGIYNIMVLRSAVRHYGRFIPYFFEDLGSFEIGHGFGVLYPLLYALGWEASASLFARLEDGGLGTEYFCILFCFLSKKRGAPSTSKLDG
jgi:hypothetical protein